VRLARRLLARRLRQRARFLLELAHRRPALRQVLPLRLLLHPRRNNFGLERMKKPAIQVIAVVLGLVVSIAALNALRKCESGLGDRHQATIGQVTEVIGQLERKKTGSFQVESVPNPRPLYNQDLLVTQKASTATLQLEPNGPSLRLNENTRFIAELDASHKGAFIGTLLDGTLTVLNPGQQGSFRLFQEGREVSPESAEKKNVPIIPSDVAGPQAAAGGVAGPQAVASPVITITASHVDESSNPTPVPTAAESAPTGDAPTNEEVIRTLKSQTGLFQRCYLSFIHRAGQASGAAMPSPTMAPVAVPAKATPSAAPVASASGDAPAGAANKRAQTGVITLAFIIQSSGKITSAKLVRSDFGDTTLHNCVTEVVERVRFKGFRGDAVPIAEFPIALQ
jgi:hypothetical protein